MARERMVPTLGIKCGGSGVGAHVRIGPQALGHRRRIAGEDVHVRVPRLPACRRAPRADFAALQCLDTIYSVNR
jgi:hypothetical protein